MHSLKSIEKVEQWTYCDCKQMAARWSDPERGTVEVVAQVPERAFLIGMNNRFLTGAVLKMMAGASGELWRGLHDEVTKSPGFVFDATHRNCWAAILRVGETSDVTWHSAQEKIKAGATVEEALFEPVEIKVNTVAKIVDKLFLSYEDIVTLAGHDASKGVIYTITCYVRGKEGFCVSPGDGIKVQAGMFINCMFTGNA